MSRILSAFLAVCAVGQVAGSTYYVDTANGNDARSGVEAQNAATPWKTIQKAADTLVAGDVILIAPGTYREEVHPANRGTGPDNPITYRALDPSRPPVVDGSVLLDPSGWRDVSLTDFRGETVAVKVHDIDFVPPALFCAGVRLTLAHEPEQVNGDDPYELERMARISAENTTSSKTTLIDTAFFTQSAADYWKGADLLVFYEGSYGNGNVIEEQKIAAYDPARHAVSVSPAFGTTFASFCITPGRDNRWCLRNHLGILDHPGEFYVDASVTPHRLYVIPPVGHDVAEVSACRYDYGFLVTGSMYNTIDGLAFIGQTKAAVFSQYGQQWGRGVVVKNCTISHQLGDGIRFNQSQNIRIENTSVSLCSNDGITFGSGFDYTVLGCTVCSNANNGIWVGSGHNVNPYTTSNVLVRSCLVFDQGGRRSHADNFQMQQCDNIEISCCRLSQSQDFQNGWCQYTGRLVFTNNVVVGGPFGFGAVRQADISHNVFDRAALRFDSHLNDAPIADKTYYLPVAVGISNNIVRASASWWPWHWDETYRSRSGAFAVDANYYVPPSAAADLSRIDTWNGTNGVGYGARSVVATDPDAEISPTAVATLFAARGISVGADLSRIPSLSETAAEEPEPPAEDSRYAAVRYLAENGVDTNDGLTPQTPMRTIRSALASLATYTAEPTAVYLAPGTYTQDDALQYNGGNCYYANIVTTPTSLIGLGETPDSVIVSNSINRLVLMLDHAGAGVYNVTLCNGLSQHANTPGGANLSISPNGGTASNCVLRAGKADNWYGHGGCASIYAGLITHCVLRDSSVTRSGGDDKAALEIFGGMVENCLIVDNTCDSQSQGVRTAAGVWINGGTLRNCTIARNCGQKNGGLVVNSANALVENCVVVGNTAATAQDENAVAYHAVDEASLNVIETSVFDGATAPNQTCLAASAANVLVNVADGDFNLAPRSPAIDVGLTRAGEPAQDLAGNNRVMGLAIDMGCYEFDPSEMTASFKADVTRGVLPCSVTFTASVEGVAPTDKLRYDWDFDGDGLIDLTTSAASVNRTFTAGGVFSVALTVVNVTTGKEVMLVKTDYLQLAPPVLYVNHAATAHVVPYATRETGAATVQEALDAAVDGCTVVVCRGQYELSDEILVDKRLVVRGETGVPDDVVLRMRENVALRILDVNHVQALVSGMALEGGRANGMYGAGVYFGANGGTVSNVVVRNCGAYNYNGRGGGIALSSPDALFTHGVISNCWVKSDGDPNASKAVVHIPQGRVENCLIFANTTPWDVNKDGTVQADCPGTIAVVGNGGSMVNCTLVGNTTERRGLVQLSQAGARLVNCVLAGNTLPDDCTPVYGPVFSDAEGAACLDHCVVQPADLSAVFRYPATGDWRPLAGGPLYNTGVTPAAAPSVDLAGNPRVLGRAIDIGCYEVRPLGFGVSIR